MCVLCCVGKITLTFDTPHLTFLKAREEEYVLVSMPPWLWRRAERKRKQQRTGAYVETSRLPSCSCVSRILRSRHRIWNQRGKSPSSCRSYDVQPLPLEPATNLTKRKKTKNNNSCKCRYLLTKVTDSAPPARLLLSPLCNMLRLL